MGVSVITTVISLVTIVIATAGFGIGAALANIIATTIATIPSYHLNRRWTWGRKDRSNPLREVLPFWVLSFAGLALSTLTVSIADSWAYHAHLAPLCTPGRSSSGTSAASGCSGSSSSSFSTECSSRTVNDARVFSV